MSSDAPAGERLRIVQSTLAPSNSITPALKTRRLGFARRSSIAPGQAKSLSAGLTVLRKAGPAHIRLGNHSDAGNHPTLAARASPLAISVTPAMKRAVSCRVIVQLGR